MFLMRNVYRFKQTNTIYMLSFRSYKKQDRLYSDSNSSTKAYLKMLGNIEFQFAHRVIMKNNLVDDVKLKIVESYNTNEEFDDIIRKDWYAEPTSAVIETFANVVKFCIKNNICISNKKFDNIIDTLTDKIQFATDDEIKTIFFLLCSYMKPLLTRNYIEIIVALDDACILKKKEMSFDDTLNYISMFHQLNVKAGSTFWIKSLNKFARNASLLSKTQLVHIMFYIAAGGNLPNSKKINSKFELYRHVQKKIIEFEIDELAVISMGLLSSQIPIYNVDLVLFIIDKIIQTSNDIHEVSLLLLLKMISYSLLHFGADDTAHIYNKVYQLIDCLQYQTERLNVSCNVQIALVGASSLVVHEPCLTKISIKVYNLMSATSLKDLEGILQSFGILGFVPPTVQCFFTKVVNELKNETRENEINEHGEVFTRCVANLGLSGIYPQDLMQRVLNKCFLRKTYGKSCHTYKREILTVHNLAEIFYKNIKISGLNSYERNIMLKMYRSSLPNEKNKIKNYNVAERRFLDIKKTLQEVCGGDNYVVGRHILTHYERGDIMICNDHQGVPQPIKKASPYVSLETPPDDNAWIVLLIAGRSNVIHNIDKPDGSILAKSRELNKLGYCPAIVKWNIYDKCKNHDEKVEYLNTLINDAVKCNKMNNI